LNNQDKICCLITWNILLRLVVLIVLIGIPFGIYKSESITIGFLIKSIGGAVSIFLLYLRFKTTDDIKKNQEKQFHLNNQYKNFLETSRWLTDKDSTIEAKISAMYLLYDYAKNYPQDIEKVYQLLGEYIKPLLKCIDENCNSEKYNPIKVSSNTGTFRTIEYKYTEKKVLELAVYNKENNLLEIINKWQILGTNTEKEISIALIIIRELTTNILLNLNEHIELSNIIIFNLDVDFSKNKIKFLSNSKPTYNLIFLNCNLKNVDFSNNKFYYCKFINCDLDEANFNDCELNYTKFYNSDLSNVSFKDVNLCNIRFERCEVKNKTIRNTCFKVSLFRKDISFKNPILEGLKFRKIEFCDYFDE